VSLALCADAAIGNYQEKSMKEHHATNNEVVLFSYSIGSVYLFVFMWLTGTFHDAGQCRARMQFLHASLW
jgi:solute carrier family 35 (adenosine 3'-phospho 5'-phosphosulfate transporter), member B3